VIRQLCLGVLAVVGLLIIVGLIAAAIVAGVDGALRRIA
jgi:hypothetical protein